MKKFLALFLIMAMLVSSLALMSSCGDTVDPADAKDDPYTLLMKASRNTLTNFFIVDEAARETIANASKKGAYSISLSNFDEDIRTGFDKMSTTFYADAENKKFATESSVVIDEYTHSSITYITKDAIAVSGNMFDNKSYKIDFNSLIENFKTSAIVKMSGLDLNNSEIAKNVDTCLDLFKDVKAAFGESYADSIKSVNEFIAIFMGEVTEETITIDGNNVDCIKMPITLNAENLKKFIDKAVGDTKNLGEYEAEFNKYKDELVKQMDAIIGENKVDFTMYINKDTSSFAKINIHSDFDISAMMGASAKTVVTVNGDFLFDSDSIVFNGSLNMNEQAYTLTAEISKKTEGDNTTFTYSCNLKTTQSGATIDFEVFNGTMKYNSKTGIASISATIPSEEITFTLALTFTSNDGKVTLAANSVSIEEDGDKDSWTFNVELTIDANKNVPSIPADAKDVIKLSEDELMALENELDAFMGRQSGGSSYDEPDISIDEDIYNDMMNEDIYEDMEDMFDEDYVEDMEDILNDMM